MGRYDAFVPVGVVERLGLLPGHWVGGTARAPTRGERYPTLIHVDDVNHEDVESLSRIVPFDKLVVTHPDRRYVLETTQDETAMRVLEAIGAF